MFAVLALAAGARLLTYAQIREGPALHLHVWTESDMHFFDRWAGAIAAGDVLTRADMRPYHERHRSLACEALARSTGAAAQCDDATVAGVWDEWVGRNTFWQDPLYPYVLGALYATVGDAPPVVYAAHAIAGIAVVWLVTSIAGTLFGAAAAAAAGIAAALYGPLMLFETLRLREAMFTACGLSAVRLAIGTIERPTLVRWTALGAVAGASVLFKASSLLFVAALVPLVACLARRYAADAAAVGAPGASRAALESAHTTRGRADVLSGPRNARAAVSIPRVLVACGVGLCLAFVPLVARNLAVGIAPLALAATGPTNFINGNAADHVPAAGSTVSVHAADILTRTRGKPAAVVRETIATHGHPTDWLVLLGRKLVAFWRSPEIPNNASWEYFLHQAPWLRASVTFGLMAPFAVLGLVAGVRRNVLALVPLLYVASGMAVCVLFYDLSRFRLPPAVGMLAFVGAAAAWTLEALRGRRLGALAATVALVGASAVVVHAPAPDYAPAIRIADYGVSNQITEQIARRRAAEGDPAGALRILERQIETEPAELRAIVPGPDPTHISESMSAVAGTFAPLHEQAAQLSAVLERPGDARRHRIRAAVLRALNAPYRKREAELHRR